MKKCSICKITKDEEEFNKNSRAKSGIKSNCKACDSNKNKAYYRTVKGLISKIYNSQLHREKTTPKIHISYSKKELHNWITSNPKFKQLYTDWVNDNYSRDKSPSCDRMDNSLGYSLDNIELMSWIDNRKNAARDMSAGLIGMKHHPVKCFDIITEKFTEFKSQKEAERITGIKQGAIFKRCRDVENRGCRLVFRDLTMEYKSKTQSVFTIIQYDLNMTPKGEFATAKIAAQSTGTNRRNITKVYNGYAKTSGGFIWVKKLKIINWG